MSFQHLELVVYLLNVQRFVPQEEDPAACFPSFTDFMVSLRRGREEDSMSFNRLLSRHSERYAFRSFLRYKVTHTQLARQRPYPTKS